MHNFQLIGILTQENLHDGQHNLCINTQHILYPFLNYFLDARLHAHPSSSLKVILYMTDPLLHYLIYKTFGCLNNQMGNQ